MLKFTFERLTQYKDFFIIKWLRFLLHNIFITSKLERHLGKLF